MPDPNENKDDKTPPAVTLDDLKKLDERVTAAEARAAKAEGALLDPSYVDYIATKAAGKNAKTDPNNGNGKGGEKKEVKAGDLTPEEFEAQLDAKADEKIAKAIDPVKQALLTKQALDDVKETAAKYPDFWEYQKEMTELAKQYPNLSAERAYKLAKAEGPKEPKKPAESEKPTGMAATKIVREPAKGFGAKADAAWNKVFGKETIAS